MTARKQDDVEQADPTTDQVEATEPEPAAPNAGLATALAGVQAENAQQVSRDQEMAVNAALYFLEKVDAMRTSIGTAALAGGDPLDMVNTDVLDLGSDFEPVLTPEMKAAIQARISAETLPAAVVLGLESLAKDVAALLATF